MVTDLSLSVAIRPNFSVIIGALFPFQSDDDPFAETLVIRGMVIAIRAIRRCFFCIIQ